MALPELERLVAVVSRLRRDCPWDAKQTHRSLVPHLVEEACETVEAIESGELSHLREELGDLLLQVIFHAEIAGESDGGFGMEEIAGGIADKLIGRHPYVFGDSDLPGDLLGSWEQRKAAEKGRQSVLEGIPEQLSALSRAAKVIGRARSHGLALELPDEPIDADDLGSQLVALVARAHAQGFDAEQAARTAVRALEHQVRVTESTAPQPGGA